MSDGPGLLLPLAGGAAGALAAVATREAVLASPALARWVRVALEPLRRAGREGYSPSLPERRRLAVLGTVVALTAGWFLLGTGVAIPLAVAGPALAAWAIKSRRRRYRRAVEAALPDVAIAVADSLSAGRSLRASLPAAVASLDGPPAVELARLAAELDLGAPTADAVAAWRQRMRSPRVDALAAALLSQRLAGGDLAGLLRRFAEGAAERDRAARGRQGGNLPGALHRIARRRDADRRRSLRRVAATRLPRQGARRPGLRDSARCGGGAAAGRLRRDSPSLEGGRVSPAGLPAGLAVLLACAAARELLVIRGSAPGRLRVGLGSGGRAARAALRLGLPDRLSRAGLEPRLPLAAVLLAKLTGAALGGLTALAAAPAAPGRLPLLVAIAMPAAGLLRSRRPARAAGSPA